MRNHRRALDSNPVGTRKYPESPSAPDPLTPIPCDSPLNQLSLAQKLILQYVVFKLNHGRGHPMRSVFRPLFYIVILGVLILSSCNLPAKSATAEPAKPTQTEASSTKVTATIELTTTLTETPALTATETLTAEPSATDTPVPIMA